MISFLREIHVYDVASISHNPFAVALAAIAAVSVAGAATGSAARKPLHGANFWVKCRFSHISNDDPIVHPRRPGRSHSHTFFGNRSTDAFSTPATLRAAATNCKERADKAAYWVPTLFQNGESLKPASIGVYHRLKTSGEIRPFPAGLKMVAGDATAVRPQSVKVTYWTCWMSVGPSSMIPTCPERPADGGVPSVLTLHVNFPDCWDGRRLDSPDHRSHMAYSKYASCPRSHPVQLPGIGILVAYPTYGGDGIAFSSGGQFSAHADFINGWDQQVLARIVARCSARNAKADCAQLD
jgi:hypothetical protein